MERIVCIAMLYKPTFIAPIMKWFLDFIKTSIKTTIKRFIVFLIKDQYFRCFKEVEYGR